jgi:hypothetical protein
VPASSVRLHSLTNRFERIGSVCASSSAATAARILCEEPGSSEFGQLKMQGVDDKVDNYRSKVDSVGIETRERKLGAAA